MSNSSVACQNIFMNLVLFLEVKRYSFLNSTECHATVMEVQCVYYEITTEFKKIKYVLAGEPRP